MTVLISNPVRGSSAAISWLLVLALIGYAPVGLLGSVFETTYAGPFRALHLGLALIVLATHLRPWPHWRRNFWLLTFLLLYALRLIFDLVARAPGDPAYLVQFFLATVFTPAIALCTARAADIDWDSVAWKLVIIGGLTCGFAVLRYQLGAELQAVANLRLEVDRLNTITIGHTAATTVLSALFLLRRARHWRTPALVALSGVAGFALLMSAARGPLLALVVCVLVYAVVTRKFFWSLLLVGFAAATLNEDSALVARFMLLLDHGATEDMSSLERIEIQGRSWEQFLSQPFLGSGAAERLSGIYPHNMWIETLMALGLVGAAVMLFLLWRPGRSSMAMIRSGRLLAPLLLTQYMIGAQLSGAIWSNGALWALLAVVSAQPMRFSAQLEAQPLRRPISLHS